MEVGRSPGADTTLRILRYGTKIVYSVRHRSLLEDDMSNVVIQARQELETDSLARLVLGEAADRIEEHGWMRGAESIDSSGHVVSHADPRACRWCATGAILRSISDHADEMVNDTHVYSLALYRLMQVMDPRSLSYAIEIASDDAYSEEEEIIIAWNDRIAISQDLVVDTIRKAASDAVLV